MAQLVQQELTKGFITEGTSSSKGNGLLDGERRLAAIMYTDIVGFTALAQRNESETMRLLEEHRQLIRPLFVSHRGREIKTIGDAFLVEFQSALDAVLCAVAIQHSMHDRKLATGDSPSLRIGVHIGDVIEKGNDILGDAVNIASRIEPLAEAGGVCITDEVYRQVRNKSDLLFISIGERSLKNVAIPVEVYAVRMPWENREESPEVYLETRRIAVLPFVSLSPDPNDEYFADGLTEELIDRLCQISGLDVIARTSVMNYKKKEKNAAQIGRELRAGALVEGSVRKADGRIRVTAQLINANTEGHLWSSRYDRNLEDIFAVQSDVANQVADALRVRILSPERERIEKKPTENTSAYGLYLKGKYYLNKRGLEDLKRAREYFELAVHEDPDFALGYVGVSDCCAILRNNWGVEREANHVKAMAMADKALSIDPMLAEAHATRALSLAQEFGLRGAEQEFKKAIELKPSYAMAHMWYYMLLSNQLRWDEAREQIEKAVELDPLAPVVYGNLAGYYWYRGDYGKAIEPLRKSIELGNMLDHSTLAWTYGLMKKYDDMKREFAAYVELSKGSVPPSYPLQLYADVWVAYFIDDKEAVSRRLPEIEAHFHDEAGPAAYFIGLLRYYLGEKDEAFEWLERSYSMKEFILAEIMADQLLGFFNGIQDDPRYLDLLKRLGLDQSPNEGAERYRKGS
jgi:TolB-like protein